MDDFATGLRIYFRIFRLVCICLVFGDCVAFPEDGVSYMQDLGLSKMALWNLGDLVVDDTVALVPGVILVHRVVEDLTNRVQYRVEITLAVDDRVFVLADGQADSSFRCRNDSQVNTIDAVHTVDALECILILLGLSDFMLQRLTAPYERQGCLTYRGVQFIQIGRHNYQRQLFLTCTSSFGRNNMLVRTGIRYYRVMFRQFIQLIGPCIRQFGISNRIRTGQIHGFIEMHVRLNDTVATVNRVINGHYRVILEIVRTVIADRTTVTTGI